MYFANGPKSRLQKYVILSEKIAHTLKNILLTTRPVHLLEVGLCREFFEQFLLLAVDLGGDEDIHNHKDIVRHADYLITQYQGRLYNMRTDYWKAEVYQGPLLKLMDQFMEENPQYAAQLDYKPGGESLTRPQLKQMLQVCGHPWYEYANADILEQVSLFLAKN